MENNVSFVFIEVFWSLPNFLWQYTIKPTKKTKQDAKESVCGRWEQWETPTKYREKWWYNGTSGDFFYESTGHQQSFFDDSAPAWV